jgi:hypothetical protein
MRYWPIGKQGSNKNKLSFLEKKMRSTFLNFLAGWFLVVPTKEGFAHPGNVPMPHRAHWTINVSPSVGNIHTMKPNEPNKQMMFAKVINPKQFLIPSVLELATKSIVEAMGIKQASQQTLVHVRKELQMDDPKSEPKK